MKDETIDNFIGIGIGIVIVLNVAFSLYFGL